MLPWYARPALQILQVILFLAVSRLKCFQTLEVLVRVPAACDAAISVYDATAHARLREEIVLERDVSLGGEWENKSGVNVDNGIHCHR